MIVMNSVSDIQNCIQKCQQTAEEIRTLAGQETNSHIKMMLTEAAHHLDLCLVECQFSVKELQNPTM